jgi:hypothetical protein
MALDDAGILEQPHRAVNRGNRDAIVDLGAAPVEFFDVRMILRRCQHARDDAALLGHPHALGGA